MTDIFLLASTGNEQIDKIIRGIVGIYETAFPGCVRGYYLLGSYTDATYVPISDIDMAILFIGNAVDGREAQINSYCSLISPIRLDIASNSEERLPPEDVRLKIASVLLYGEDSRDSIALPTVEVYHRYMTGWPYYFFTRMRNVEYLTFPMDYPNHAGAFYGYDRKSIPQWYPASMARGTKELVASMCWTATTIVALRTGRYIGKKAEGIRAYKELIADEWAMFVQDVYQKCKLQWNYLVPEAGADQRVLRNLCQQVLAFENHYLTIYKDYLLAQLHSESREDQFFALKRLREVIYRDEEIKDSLQTLEAIDDEELREAAKETLSRMQ